MTVFFFKKSFIIFLIFTSFSVFSQVGIGTTTPDPSSVLDIQATSNDKGILIPRLTQAQRNAIGSPATGLMIFQTDGNAGFYFYDGSSWDSFGEVKSVNGSSPASNGNVTITFLATQTGTQADRAATASPSDGLVHIVRGDPTPAENDKVYIYSTGISTWTLSSGFVDTDEQDILGSSFTDATSALLIDIEDGTGQTLSLSALEELVNDTDPATNLTSASEGDLAYDTTDDELQAYDGTNWLAVDSGVVTPTLDQVTDVGSTTTNGISVGSLTVNSAFTLPTATGTAGQVLTVSTTTSELVFTTIAATTTPSLDQVTDVGSTTTNNIEVGGATVTGDLTVNTDTSLEGNTTIGDAIADDLTVTARLASDLIPKTNNARNLGDSTLNFGEVNTRSVISNDAMTVSATGILTLNSSATGTPTISFQQSGNEMAGIGSSTFFIGDSSGGNQYFFPSQYNVSPLGGYDNTKISVLASSPSTFPNELVFANIDDIVSKTLSDVTLIDNFTPNGIVVTGGSFTVSGTSAQFKDDVTMYGSLTNSITITLGVANGTDDLKINGLLSTSIGLATDTLEIGTPSTTLLTTYTQYINSGESDLALNSSDENGEVNFTVDGFTIAGVNSSTFMVTDGTNFYSFPEISTLPSPANQVLALTDTNTLTFYNVPSLPSGTVTGSIIRYNHALSQWEETNSLVIDTGGSIFDDNIVVSFPLVPRNTNTHSLGKTSYEFSNVFTQKIETAQADLELTTNGQSIFLKYDGDNLIFNSNSSVVNSNNDGNTGFGFQALGSSLSDADNNTAVGYESLDALISGNNNTAIGYGSLTANTSGANNTAIGYNALSQTTTVTGLTAVGYEALKRNTSGAMNTATGYEALYDNTIGNNNTANGYQALKSNTIGRWNTAVGALALTANVDGYHNTAIGYKSLLTNDTGYNNTANGREALRNNTGGSYNTAIGNAALYYNIGGNDNTAVGHEALIANTTGNNNIATGGLALQRNQGGNQNVASGYMALRKNVSGNHNVAVGFSSLVSNTASYNTAIGWQALENNTTGTYNTAIGYSANVATSNLTNATAIGYNATVTTSNTIQLGNNATTNINTSGIVSSTGFITAGTVTATNVTIETQLTFSSNATTISPLQLNATSLNDGVGALSIDSVEPDINLNDTDGGFSTVTFEDAGIPRTAFGRNSGNDFYITVRDPAEISGAWRDDAFVIDSKTGALSLGYVVTTASNMTVNGNLTVSGIGTVGGNAITSDVRLKSNIFPSKFGLKDLMNLSPKVYDKYKTPRKENLISKEIGFIAQDLEKVLPILVKKGIDKDSILSVNYTSLIPVLTKAIQEQQSIIEENKLDISKLKNQLKELKEAIEQLK